MGRSQLSQGERKPRCHVPSLILQGLKDGDDAVNDGMLLFVQHGLILNNYTDAIKFGDPERVLSSIKHFTVWFQGTRHQNYGREMMHLQTCLQKVWSPEFVAFYKRNMLINMSGKSGDWLPCDAINEDVVKENKAMIGDRLTPETDNHVRTVNALLIFCFRGVRARLASECDAYISDNHSSAVSASRDICTVANLMLRDNACTRNCTREVKEGQKEIRDLFIMGQKRIAETTGLSEYKKVMVSKGCAGWDGEFEEGLEDRLDNALGNLDDLIPTDDDDDEGANNLLQDDED
jgi:hypothetical protein